MKRNIIKLIMCVVLISTCFAFTCAAVEQPGIASDEVINTIKILEIANGDENGNMNFNNTVTRAEFIKMAVSASTEKDKAQNAVVTFSMFPDVKRDYWGAGYIAVAMEGELVNGYLDGTFKPNNEVTLEEAVTIVLRLLGYTSQDFTGSYPTSQLEKYYELELNENISAVKGDKLTREQCMILLHNMLCTKNKSGAVYCTTLGHAADNDGKIDYSTLIEEKLEGPIIITENADLSSLSEFTVNEFTQYHLNNAPALKSDIKENDVIYYSDKINAVFSFRNTATGIISSFSSGNTVSLHGGMSYKVDTKAAKNKLSIGGEFNEKNSFVTLILGLNDTVIDVVPGDVSKITENSDNASYVSMIEKTISLPLYLNDEDNVDNWTKNIPFDTTKASVFIDGASSTEYSPALYDVLYYSKPFNSIWVYRTTKSGTLTAATSSAITLGTKTYSIATDRARIKVSAYGTFKADSYVTLVLGKNEEVIDIFGNPETSDINDDTIEATVGLPVYFKNAADLTEISAKIPFDIENAKVFINGVEAESAEFKAYDVIYYSKPYMSIWVFRDTVSGVLTNSNSTTVTVGSTLYNLGSTEAKNKVSAYGKYKADDYVTLILGKNDEVIDIVDASTADSSPSGDITESTIESTISLPIYIRDEAKLKTVTSEIPFELNKATIYVNGQKSTDAKFKALDVVYYSKPYMSVWIIRETASGVLTNSNSTTVTVGSTLYNLGSTEAKNKVSSYGTYKADDYVTLILGKNDEVIDIVDASTADSSPSGDITESNIESTISLPIYIRDEAKLKTVTSEIPFELNKATIYVNGQKSTDAKFKALDVVYYSKPYMSVWIIRETASGVITSISDLSVSLGNDIYSLGTTEAQNKVSAFGIYKVDDYVTAILGKNDEVIDFIVPVADDEASVGNMTDATIESTISLPVYIRDESVLDNWTNEIPFDISESVFYLNGKKTAAAEIKVLDVLYYSKPYRSVWIFRDTASGLINTISSPAIILGNKTYTLATTEAKNKVSNYGPYGVDDYVTAILGRGNEIVDIIDADVTDIGKNENDSSYSDVVSGSLKGPYIISADSEAEKLPFEIEQAKIFYLNKEISASEIQPYDVYYYSTVLNTVWIYRDSVSGTIEEITPVAAPLSVVMSGKTYTIESSRASYDLSSFGSYGVGDKATFLLGMDGKVAGVVSVDEVSRVYYGIVTAKGSKQFKEKDGDTYTAEYVTITDLSCNAYTYEYGHRGLGVGDIVRVSVGETVKISKQSTNIGRGNLATVINAINNKQFSDNCKIVEIYGSTVKKIYPSRFDDVTLDLDAFLYSSTVLYFKTDSNNHLSELVLNNFTGDLCDYGIVTGSSSTQITYMTDNNKKTFVVSGISCSEGPALINTSEGSVTSIKTLTGSIEDVDFITKDTVYDSNDKEYPISENVKVFVQNPGSYKYISIDDAVKGNYTYEAYYDKTPSKGGRVRVIIAIPIP